MLLRASYKFVHIFIVLCSHACCLIVGGVLVSLPHAAARSHRTVTLVAHCDPRRAMPTHPTIINEHTKYIMLHELKVKVLASEMNLPASDLKLAPAGLPHARAGSAVRLRRRRVTGACSA